MYNKKELEEKWDKEWKETLKIKPKEIVLAILYFIVLALVVIVFTETKQMGWGMTLILWILTGINEILNRFSMKLAEHLTKIQDDTILEQDRVLKETFELLNKKINKEEN